MTKNKPLEHVRYGKYTAHSPEMCPLYVYMFLNAAKAIGTKVGSWNEPVLPKSYYNNNKLTITLPVTFHTPLQINKARHVVTLLLSLGLGRGRGFVRAGDQTQADI